MMLYFSIVSVEGRAMARRLSVILNTQKKGKNVNNFKLSLKAVDDFANSHAYQHFLNIQSWDLYSPWLRSILK